MIAARGLGKRFGEKRVLHGVHLELPETGVCSRDLLDDSPSAGAGGCCASDAPSGAEAVAVGTVAVAAPARTTGCCR